MHTIHTTSKLVTATLLVAMLVTASSAFAANVTLLSSDASNTSNFTTYTGNGSTTGWNDFTSPGAANDYFTGAFILRTPTTGDNTFAGNSLTVQTGGSLTIKSAASSTQTINNLILNGGIVSLSGASFTGTSTYTLAGNITVSADSSLKSFASSSSNLNILNITAAISGSANLALPVDAGTANNARGTIRLSAANTYGGTITVTSNPFSTTHGALQLNNLNAVQNASLNLTPGSGKALTFLNTSNVGTYNIGALAGNAALSLTDSGGSSAVAISVGSNNATTAYSGAISGTGSLTKAGTGTMTLSGTNTYSGATTVNAGTLLVTGSITSAVTVNAGSFGGSGSSSATVAIGDNTGSGDAFFKAGGAASVGTFTASSAVTFNADGVFAVDFNSTTSSFDKLVASGLTLNAGAALNLTDLGSTTLGLGQSFTIVDNTGGSSISGTFNSLTEGSTITVGSNAFLISYLGGTGNDITLTTVSAVPEPSTYAALVGLAALAFVAVRRPRS